MAKSAPKLNRRPPHPLQTLRFATGLTREACGDIADLTASTVQNIELGKAPLYLENAELIEAYTGCSALRLLELQEQWKDGKLKTRAELVALNGRPFTSETYDAYKATPIPTEDRERAIEDIRTRIDLILGGLGERSHDFRAAYRRMSQFTIKERERAVLSNAEIEQRGQSKAMVETKQTTLAQLAKEEFLKGSGLYKKTLSKRYKPSTKVNVSIEEFPSWMWPKRNMELMLLTTPNLQTDITFLWRLSFPDKQQYTLRAQGVRWVKMEPTSLSQELFNEIIRPDRTEDVDFKKWSELRRKLSRKKRPKT
jgi:transcriptional regulator with XRE-family HTH domain